MLSLFFAGWQDYTSAKQADGKEKGQQFGFHGFLQMGKNGRRSLPFRG
jgi:hypothetical protein